MAAKDKQRQKRREEQARQEGSWTGGITKDAPELESEAEALMCEQEWQLKTKAREQVRLEAEARGELCYYPDGSGKGGRSGWGWVSTLGGAESARSKGPD